MLLSGTVCIAQETTIYGKLPDYAGYEFVFETYDDYISHESTVLGKCTVQADGNFKASFKLKQSKTAFVKAGIYQGFIILEPGKSYNILLPEKTEKTENERLNPFFKEIRVYIQLRENDSTELNTRRRHLSRHINNFMNRNIQNISIGRMSRSKVEAFIDSTRIMFPAKKSDYFYSHREYIIGNLRNITYSRSMFKLTDLHFKNKPILYHNEDYMKLFNQVFDRFFVLFGQGEYGHGIHDKIGSDTCLHTIRQQIAKCPSFSSDSFIDLLILKGLYDGYYFGDYHLEEVVPLLDSLEMDTKVPENKTIARNIRKKLTQLALGYPAPSFELSNQKSETIKLESLKGKYVYINFCSYQNPTCTEEFVLLNELHKKYKDKLAIVSISTDEDPSEFFNYMKTHKYKWTCLSINDQPEVLKTYRARVIPSYYLIDPYNKVLLAPSLSPRENFENEFHRILNNRK